MTRICKKCLIEKDLMRCFSINSSYKNKIYYDWQCKECKRKYNSEYWGKNYKDIDSKRVEYKRNQVKKKSESDRKNLHDNYVKNTICRNSNFEIRFNEIPSAMVCFKREQLTLLRLIRKGVKYGVTNNRN